MKAIAQDYRILCRLYAWPGAIDTICVFLRCLCQTALICLVDNIHILNNRSAIFKDGPRPRNLGSGDDAQRTRGTQTD